MVLVYYENFCVTNLDLKGLCLAEKSKMMAEHWRNLCPEDKGKYRSSVGSSSEDSDTELSSADKKRAAIRAAKRHQGDVSSYKLSCLVVI